MAIKIIDTDTVREPYVIKNLTREAKLLAKLQHPSIVHLYETIRVSRNKKFRENTIWNRQVGRFSEVSNREENLFAYAVASIEISSTRPWAFANICTNVLVFCYALLLGFTLSHFCHPRSSRERLWLDSKRSLPLLWRIAREQLKFIQKPGGSLTYKWRRNSSEFVAVDERPTRGKWSNESLDSPVWMMHLFTVLN